MHTHDYKFQPSTSYACLLALVSLGTLVVIAALQWPVLYKLLLFACVSMYVAKLYREVYLRRGQHAITQLIHQPDGAWYVCTATQKLSAALLGDSTITPWVCVLRFKLDGVYWPRTCLVFRDALSVAAYKHLVMTVRMT